jgi:Protein of unknown function DUF262/Schlafen, AlbA_2
MSTLQQDLAIRGETIQRIYGYYVNRRMYANRRYQRKLVWSIEEKRDFIDSLIRGFPVPLILFAETQDDLGKRFEIIDGIQRLNAIVAFIEGEYEYKDSFFDLNTMAESKQLLDDGSLKQFTPALDRGLCTRLASYYLAVSVYSFESTSDVDEIFRRINASGRHLSRQELRTAGATGRFAELVREVASLVRGDASASDILPLNAMKEISITNRSLPYGISVDQIFWVRNNILTSEMVRESRDEEMVADLLANMCLPSIQPSRVEVFDEYYGFRQQAARYGEIEAAIQKYGADNLSNNFIKTYDQLQNALSIQDRPFANLVVGQKVQRAPRYFQVIFLAMHDLIVDDGLEVADRQGLANALDGLGDAIRISPGGKWAAKEKERNVDGIKGILRKFFRKAGDQSPVSGAWITQLETLLTQSFTEQSLYDFKQGFVSLDGKNRFDGKCVAKVAKTLSAMANVAPGATGYVVVGVADDDEDARRVRAVYGEDAVEFRGFKICGIDREARALGKSLDEYFANIVEEFRRQPVSEAALQYLLSHVRLPQYHGRSVLVLEIKSQAQPSHFEGKYYVRQGGAVKEVVGDALGALFGRFR